jgi:hypothetical protein
MKGCGMNRQRHVAIFAIELPIHLAAQLADLDFPVFRAEADVQAIATAKFHDLAQSFLIPHVATVRASFLRQFTMTYVERRDARLRQRSLPARRALAYAPICEEA